LPRTIASWRRLAPIALAGGLVLGGAARASPVELSELRSLAAEAAALEHGAQTGRVTQAYATALGAQIRRDVEKLVRRPALARAARATLEAMDRHDEARLRALRDALVARERAHGRAA
jgi:hypothetical protein